MEYRVGNTFSWAELLGLLLNCRLDAIALRYGLLLVIHYFKVSSPCFPHPPSAAAKTESTYFSSPKIQSLAADLP